MAGKKWLWLSLSFVVVFGGISQSASIGAYINHVRGVMPELEYGQQWGTAEYALAQHVQRNGEAPDVEEEQEAVSPQQREELLKLIREEAEKRYVPPIDAYVDRVWKAIPGYNGLEVDVEATLRAALDKGVFTVEEIPFDYREVPPKIGLDDLGAQPIYKGNPNKPMAALMINVAWGNEYIPGMLETLEKENVKASFFFLGSWLNHNAETAKLIQEKGHELSNHAYSHKNMSGMTREQAIYEITRTEELLKEHLQADNRLFAPPSGDFNMATVQIAHELNLRTVLWTLDTVDWKKPSPETILNRLVPRLQPGSMILMHPTSSASGALEGLIRAIKDKGLAIGTVSELISADRVPEVETLP